MKKNFFYVGMMALAVLTVSTATSCSNDDVLDGNGGTEIATGEQVIVLDMQDTDVLSTKSRPIYSTSNQGSEKVTDVKLLIFQHAKEAGLPMTLKRVIPISKWDQTSSDYTYGRKYVVKLEGDQKLAKDETYTILAVGQDESNTEAKTFAPYKILAGGKDAAWISGDWSTVTTAPSTWNAGSNTGEGFLLTEARTGKNEAEIFSGISKPVTLAFDGGFNAEVLLKRQVAGVLGYFSNIPAVVKEGEGFKAVKKIRLVASAKNTQLDLTRSLAVQVDDATGMGNLKVESVMNGFTLAKADAKFKSGAEAYTVYTIDLSKWFKVATGSANNLDYWYTGAKSVKGDVMPSLGATQKDLQDILPEATSYPTWVNAFDQANSYPAVATNSVLAGEFMIPFSKSSSQNTFELQLLGGEADEILKSWNVKLDQKSISEELGDKEYVFNTYRNQLYQIGKRGNGDNPTDPGTDPDKPQPLDKDQELTIKINDQWEFIHDMEID